MQKKFSKARKRGLHFGSYSRGVFTGFLLCIGKTHEIGSEITCTGYMKIFGIKEC